MSGLDEKDKLDNEWIGWIVWIGYEMDWMNSIDWIKLEAIL